jgi:hypothetical protein
VLYIGFHNKYNVLNNIINIFLILIWLVEHEIEVFLLDALLYLSNVNC